eukprot:403345403
MVCDQCQQEFDVESRVPMVISQCGHSLCKQCILKLLKTPSSSQKECPLCKTKINQKSLADFITNRTLIKIIQKKVDSKRTNRNYEDDKLSFSQSGRNSPMLRENNQNNSQPPTNPKDTRCLKHTSKDIEFFCNQCQQIVCSLCIFHDHNGHELTQLEEAIVYLKSDLVQVDNNLSHIQQINDDNIMFLKSKLNEVDKLKEIQQKNLDRGFEELIRRIEEKKQNLKNDFNQKYDKEKVRLEDTMKPYLIIQNRLEAVKHTYTELSEMLMNKTSAFVLGRIQDVMNKMKQASDTLQDLYLQTDLDKKAIQINDTLRPLTINIEKAFKLISQFKIEHQGQSNNAPIGNNKFTHSSNRMSADYSGPGIKNSIKLMPLEGTLNLGSSIHNNQLNENRQSLGALTDLQMEWQPSHPYRPSLMLQQESAGNNNNANKSILMDSPNIEQLKYGNIGNNQNSNNNNLNDSRTYNPLNNQILNDEQMKNQEYQRDFDSIQKNRYIYCYGDIPFFLKYDIFKNFWAAIKYDPQSHFQGTLRYSSLCRVQNNQVHIQTDDKDLLIMTGGVQAQTGEPVSNAFKINAQVAPSFMMKLSDMRVRRFGHCSVDIKGQLIVIGGFCHVEGSGQAPRTLSSVEKYSIELDQWTPLSDMRQARAYQGACPVKNHNFIYVFGGLHQHSIISSIEQYDVMQDTWTEVNVLMPSRIIKFGCVAINSSEILLCGGIFGDSKNEQFSYVNTSYKFDLYTNKWTVLPRMFSRRVLDSCLPYTPQESYNQGDINDARVYAIGGAFDGSCECFNLNSGKWQQLNGYEKLLKDNDLQTFAISLV